MVATCRRGETAAHGDDLDHDGRPPSLRWAPAADRMIYQCRVLCSLTGSSGGKTPSYVARALRATRAGPGAILGRSGGSSHDDQPRKAHAGECNFPRWPLVRRIDETGGVFLVSFSDLAAYYHTTAPHLQQTIRAAHAAKREVCFSANRLCEILSVTMQPPRRKRAPSGR
jgi:hypothetical protein